MDLHLGEWVEQIAGELIDFSMGGLQCLSPMSCIAPELPHTDSSDRQQEYRKIFFKTCNCSPLTHPPLCCNTLLSLGLNKNKIHSFPAREGACFGDIYLQRIYKQWRTVWTIQVQILVNSSFRAECILSRCTLKISNPCMASVSLSYPRFSIKQTVAFFRHYK